MGTESSDQHGRPSDIILSEGAHGSIRDELDVLRKQLSRMGPAHLRDGTCSTRYSKNRRNDGSLETTDH